jgi:anti-sigma-K factor RskA
MSDDDTIDTIEPGDGDLVAAEYVLVVLTASQRHEVDQRLTAEPGLAAEVAFWEERLSGLTDAVDPVRPSPEVWSRIEAAVDADVDTPRAPTLWHSLTFWRSVSAGTAALAAASLGALAVIGFAPEAHPPLLATLSGGSGQPNFVASVTAEGGNLVIVPAALLTSDPHAYELWLIPAGETRPRSLGLVQPGQPARLDVPQGLASRLTADATLAVSLEPPGGSPTGQPTGPVIATGKLTSL